MSNLLPIGKSCRASTRGDINKQPPRSVPSTHTAISSHQAALALGSASVHSPSPAPYRARACRLESWKVPEKVPATLTVNKQDAFVCKFAYGPGLIGYIIGTLITTARVALKVNIATLEFAKKLPLNDLGAIGACLATAVVEGREAIEMVAYCEMDEKQVETWRWALCEWDTFPGGPHEYHELSYLSHSMRQMQEGRAWFYDHGPVDEDEGWAALSDRDRTSSQGEVEYILLRPYTRGGSLSLQCSSNSSSNTPEACTDGLLITKKAPNMTEAQFDALSHYDDSFSSEGKGAVELCSLARPMTLRDSFSDSPSNKGDAPQWSPGPGAGPIMSTAEFEALPEWSDVEDDPDWNSAADVQSELSEFEMVM